MHVAPFPSAPFPAGRQRRTRTDPFARALVAEHRLHVSDLIWPIFICGGTGQRQPIASMPGQFRVSVDQLEAHVADAAHLGIPALALFPHEAPHFKSNTGTRILDEDNLLLSAARTLKTAYPQMGLIGDTALDCYTDHGHDGVLSQGRIDNDATLAVMARAAPMQAAAGIDIIAPSDMMDGRVGVIRAALDAAGHTDTKILSYAAKYASAFYGPFRDAVGTSAALQGDKRTYQLDPANTDEAMREVAADLAEGADMVMVKPGMPYLDIVRRVHETFHVPTFAYQVSGEYAMIMAAVQNGWLDHDRAMLESLLAFKRAGAAGVLTYFAVPAAKVLA